MENKGSRNQLLQYEKLLEILEWRLKNERIYYFKPNRIQRLYILIFCKISLLIGSNQFGKTDGMIYKFLLFLIGEHPAQKMGWFPKPPIYARLTAANEKEGIKLVLEPKIVGGMVEGIPGNGMLPPAQLASYNKTTHHMTLKNGSSLELMSREQEVEKFGGPPRHLCGEDEPPDESIYNENFARLTKYDGLYDIGMTPQPKRGLTWIYRKVLKKDGQKGIKVFQGRIEDNIENLSKEGIKAFKESLTDEREYKARYLGEFVELSGLLFKEYREWNRARPVPLAVLMEWRKYPWFRGIDLGIGKGHPTTCLWAVVVPEILNNHVIKVIHIVGEYSRENTGIRENAYNIRKQYTGFLIILSYIDPVTSRVREVVGLKTTQQQEWMKAGIPCTRGLKDVGIGISSIKEFLLPLKDTQQPRLIIHDNCPLLMAEMEESTEADLKDHKKCHMIGPLRWLSAARIQNYIHRRIEGAIYENDEEKFSPVHQLYRNMGWGKPPEGAIQ